MGLLYHAPEKNANKNIGSHLDIVLSNNIGSLNMSLIK